MENMNIVVVGHVDHGKSSVIGRLLVDTNSLPEGKLEQVKNLCERTAKTFEYAFLLDALENERDQGITIDMARCFFKTTKRRYIILDAPGHIEFLKNMVTGASRAEAALLVIDAKEGIQENSLRHGLLLSLLGIKQIAVCINKMDLVNFSKEVYEQIKSDYTQFLSKLGIKTDLFIPISAINGHNLATRAGEMSWYSGPTIIEILDQFKKEEPVYNRPFRMPLQGVYKFTNQNDEARYFSGKIESGTIKVGDEVIFLPSRKKSRIKTIEFFGKTNTEEAIAGQSVGFTLTEQVFAKRGDILCKTVEDLPYCNNKIRVNLFWMGKNPLILHKNYFIKLGTSKIPVKLVKINHILKADKGLSNEISDQVNRHDVADCILELKSDLAFDMSSNLESTGRFVIVDDYEISGGGIVKESVEDSDQEEIKQGVLERELNFIYGPISSLERAEKYSQRPTLVLISGNKNNKTSHKDLAQSLEQILFYKGRKSYYLATGSLIHGLDLDIEDSDSSRAEVIRRLAEVCFLMLEAGLIVVVSAQDILLSEYEMIKTIIGQYEIHLVEISSDKLNSVNNYVYLKDDENKQNSLGKILKQLAEKQAYFTL